MNKRNGKMKYLAIGAAGLIAAGGLALDATYQIQEQEQAVLTTFGVPKAWLLQVLRFLLSWS